MTAKELHQHALIAKRLNEIEKELREIHKQFTNFEIPFGCRLNEPCASVARAEQYVRHAIFEAAHRFAELDANLAWLYHRPDLYDFNIRGEQDDQTQI